MGISTVRGRCQLRLSDFAVCLSEKTLHGCMVMWWWQNQEIEGLTAGQAQLRSKLGPVIDTYMPSLLSSDALWLGR